ncbi:MAG TPA: pyridoxamine 5'-phosphate oxidase family protein [Candidatus Limnocylindrales bacterium]|nr:pyridoxamine 5'-phosphate oxidase family protein [Candidatus Limnocylindrales bacterium]
MAAGPALVPWQKDLLDLVRRAVLATIAADGHARLVPIAFIWVTGHSKLPMLYSALDDKPKSVVDPRDLARVHDIGQRPRVTVLVDHWSEDWYELAWLRLEGNASVLEPTANNTTERSVAIAALRAKYPQYATHWLEEAPLIRIAVDRLTGWRSNP